MSRRNPIGDTTIHAAGRQLRAIPGSRRVSGRRGCGATSLQKGMARPRGVEPLTPRSQIGWLSVYDRAETQRRDRPPEAQSQQGFHPSRSSCPTNDPYNSVPSLQQLSLSRRIATSSASARAEGCARRARRGVPGFSPRDTRARACRCAFLITGAFCDPAVNQARPESGR